MRVAIFLFFISLGKVAPSVMPPTLAEHPLSLAAHPLIQTERPLTQAEHPLVQSECSLIHAEHPLKLIARCDTVIANHAFSVSNHETVISCPAFPIMVISIMINSRSAPLGIKTPIAASTRYGLVLAAIGRVGCCVVAEVCRASTSFCCGVAEVWLGARPVLLCARSVLLRGRGAWLGRRGRVSP